MIHNVVQFGNILCMYFESFGELHFRLKFHAGAVRRCIAIVRAIQADCLARQTPTRQTPVHSGLTADPKKQQLSTNAWLLPTEY